MTPAEYRAKARLMLERAEEESGDKAELMRLALSYLRLADMAEKNAVTDLVYETPTIRVPMQQQPQAEQQQQSKIKTEK
jgi:hypothetical protein